MYPLNKISLCHFHVSKSIVKKMVTEGLSNFIKKFVQTEEVWVYEEVKKLLSLQLLPETNIKEAFLVVKNDIIAVVFPHLNPYQKEGFNNFFDYLSKNYFENDIKITKLCKFDMSIRTTNLIEAAHGALSKSSFTFKNGSINNCIHGEYFY